MLGGDLLPGGKQILCPGPYHSNADRSLSVLLDPDATDGFVVHSFTGDDPLACRDYVRDALDLPGFSARRQGRREHNEAHARKRSETQAQQTAYAEKQREKARWLWSISQPILGTPAARYLREKRQLSTVPDTLRYLPLRNDHPPALIAAYGLPDEPEAGRYAPLPVSRVVAVHITRLLPDGSDRDRSVKKIMMASPGPHPIALIPLNDLGGLVVAEGVETALSFAHTGLGCWAAGAKDRLVTIAPAIAALPCIEAVTVSPDEDSENVAVPSVVRSEELAEMLADLRPDIEVRIA
jgi:hypothetical protein